MSEFNVSTQEKYQLVDITKEVEKIMGSTLIKKRYK